MKLVPWQQAFLSHLFSFLPPAATGLFKYSVKSSRISAQGLSVLYCVSVLCVYDGFHRRAGDIPEFTKYMLLKEHLHGGIHLKNEDLWLLFNNQRSGGPKLDCIRANRLDRSSASSFTKGFYSPVSTNPTTSYRLPTERLGGGGAEGGGLLLSVIMPAHCSAQRGLLHSSTSQPGLQRHRNWC